jgi:hypothetical protein
VKPQEIRERHQDDERNGDDAHQDEANDGVFDHHGLLED